MRKLIPLLFVGLIGCGSVGQNPEPVQVAGRITRKGKPVSDVVFNLQPIGAGAQAALPIKAGAFAGQVTPGIYTFYISEGRSAAAYRAIPEHYRSGSLDRQVKVGDGTDLTIALD